MCGIAGYYSHEAPATGAQKILATLGSIAHRGPDDQGIVLVNTGSGKALNCSTRASDSRIREALPDALSIAGDFIHDLSFAHCRYSIVDLTPAGHQPMWDTSSQVCVCFNGEIYNYLELRQELESTGRLFATRSDTEVLLAGYLEWGTEVFRRLNGQWAVALYDARGRKLLFSRDRLGKVPLYYAVRNKRLHWASEIKAILEACGRDAFEVRAQAVDDYVVEGWRDRNGTFWEDINDFPPACFAWVNSDLSLDVSRYWKLPESRLRAADISAEQAARQVRELLLDAIRLRVRADVPVAFELSGGMDSSSLVALAARYLPTRLTTYTIEFADSASNEEPFARAVAARFGDRIDYRIIRPGHDDFWRDANDFLWLEEEPFHAPNLQTNQSLRRRMKENGTKVVISGSAGDEVLAGYNNEYFAPYLLYLATRFRWGPLVHEFRANTEYEPTWKSAVRLGIHTLLPERGIKMQRERSGEKRLLQACYAAPAGVIPQPLASLSLSARMRANMGAAKMNYWLRSANKANFGIPIEPRAPFLDYRVVDCAFSLPPEYLIRDGWHKWVLRKAMSDLLPAEVLWRRNKMGFPFPIAQWLLTSKPRVAANLADSACPYLNYQKLMQYYEALITAAPFTLWRLVNLGLWWRRVIEGRSLESGVS